MEWFFLEVTDHVGSYRTVQSRDGRSYVRFPVGFPHRLLLRDRHGLLTDAAQLRLMKAVSLALKQSAAQRGTRSPDRWPPIVVQVAPGNSLGKAGLACSPIPQGLLVEIEAEWIAMHDTSPLALQAALEQALDGTEPSAPERAPSPPDDRPAGAPKVLLFRNLFSEHYHQRDASHLNPGVHVLATALRRAGATLIFCNAKLPYHDPAEAVPRRDVDMTPNEFLSDPDELEQLLTEHPDIDLVALSVIEFCYNHFRHLIEFIRRRSAARIAIGGTWPTTAPLHAFANLRGADLLVRGDGDRLIVPLARFARQTREAPAEEEPALLRHLGDHHGILARWRGGMAAFGIDQPNVIADLDQTDLDFGLLERPEVQQGISLSLSRGCAYGCRFCSVMSPSEWRAVSPRKVRRWLSDYTTRLRELYGSPAAAPPAAREVEIWDDDFFIDAERAMAIVDLFVEHDLRITYVQGSVPSFFARSGTRADYRIHHRLLDRLARAAASHHLSSILIGAESYSETELRRVGKTQTYAMIRTLAAELARRGIQQSHLMIVVNRATSLDDLLDSLLRLSELRRLAGPQLHFNDPCWLIELYTTPLYRVRVIEGTADEMGNLGVAHCEGYPEFDFPFVLPERPLDDEVFEIVRRFPRSQHYGIGGDPADRFDGIYGPEDEDFSLVLRYIAEHLTDRLRALDEAPAASSTDRRRIQAALDRIAKAILPDPEAEGAPRAPAPELTTGVSYRYAEDDAEPATLDSVRFRVTHRCNRKCCFCFIPYQEKAAQDLAVAESIEAVAASGGPTIILTGGEPTLHPELCDLIRRARSRGARRVELQSNAIRLADRDFCRQLLDAGLAGVTVSLPSHRDEVLTEITTVPHSLAKILKGLENLASVGLGVSITHVICPQNFRDVPAFVRFLSARATLLKFCFLFATPIHPELAHPDIIVRFSDAAAPLTQALDFCIEQGIPFEGLSERCGVPQCILAGQRRYFPNAPRIPDDNRSEDFMQAPSCPGCARRDRCYGVRRLYAYVYGTAEFRPILADGDLGEVPAPTLEQVALATMTPGPTSHEDDAPGEQPRQGPEPAEQLLALIDRVGTRLGLDGSKLAALRGVEQDLHFRIRLSRDDGQTRDLDARRARYAVQSGPTVGALELSAGADPQAVRSAAVYRGIRAAAFQLPMGGAHGVIAVDRDRLDPEACEGVVEAFVAKLVRLVGEDTDVLTPHTTVPWEIVTRCVERTNAPGRVRVLRGERPKAELSSAWMPSVASAAAAARFAVAHSRKKAASSLRYAIRGFGRAGQHLARQLDTAETPSVLVACADSRITCVARDGLPTQELLATKARTGRLPDAHPGSTEEMLSASVDVLFLCDRGVGLDLAAARSVQAPVVVDMSAAVEQEVERHFAKQGCLFVPAIVSTSGPMIAAHLELESGQADVSDEDAEREIAQRIHSVMSRALPLCERYGLTLTEAVFGLGLLGLLGRDS